MSRQIKGLLYFYSTDLRHSLLVFWSILMGILVISLVLTYLMPEDGFMTLSLTGPMYVYCGILGYLFVKQMIPYTIKMGATRKNIMVSLAIFFIGLSTSFAVLASVIQEIINKFHELLGVDIFMFLHLSYFLTDTMWSRILIDASIMFFSMTLTFILGLIFYKYGLAIFGSILGTAFLVFIVGLAKGWLIEFGIKLYQSGFDLIYFWQLLLIGIVLFSLSWLMLRKITTVETK